jgi:hypothetical protein
MGLRAEPLPDGSPWVSFLYGPVVLAARAGNDGVGSLEAPEDRMGHVASRTLLPRAGTPVVSETDPLDAVVAGEQQPESGHAFTGESTRVGRRTGDLLSV